MKIPTNRFALVASVFCLAIAVPPAPLLAHTGERALVLLLPTGHYLVGGSIAVAATFLMLAFMPKGISDRIADVRIPLLSLRPPTPAPTSLLAFLYLVFLVVAGFRGDTDPLENPLPLSIWILWWVGFTVLVAVVGNVWAYVNPWIGPYRSLIAAIGRRASPPPLRYPARLGYWPAVVLFLSFAWFEKVSLAPADPERLAVAVIVYWSVNFVAMLLFGETAWLKRGEPFTVFFRFVGRLSPLVWEAAGGGRQRLSLAAPGAALLGRAALPLSGVVFVVLALTLESFDGLSETFWWLGLNGINPLEFPGRSAVVGINAAGILISWAVLLMAYVGAVALGWQIAGRPMPLHSLLGTLVFSLMPIALGFHFAHYLTALLVDGQYAYIAASDPFSTGLDLFGTGELHVTLSFLNTLDGARQVWNAQTAAIVAGHVLGILLAHELACRSIGDYRVAVISQAPLAIVMVAYTLFGLWLLATPVAR